MPTILNALMNVPVDVWVGLTGIIFGSLLTTFGVWLTNRANAKLLKQQLLHQEKIQNQQIIKERFEELYILVCHWLNSFFSNYLHLRLVMEGKTDYNQYLDSIIKHENSANTNFSRIEMIIGIYGIQLRRQYEAVIAARTLLNEISLEHKISYKKGDPGHVYLESFTTAQLALEDACENLKTAISDAARNA